MTPDEFLLKDHSPEPIEVECRKSLGRLLSEIHSPASLDDLWPVIQANAVYRELSENWLSWTESYRKREWEALCREMEKAAYATRPYCLRCGDCCRQGSPSLYIEDLPILRQGTIRRFDLLTLRAGEIGFSNAAQDLVLLPEERIKVKEKPGSRECLLLDPETNSCRIYEDRPLQCQAMECWNPESFDDLNSQRFISRKQLLNPNDPIIPIIESHSQRCAVSALQEALSRIKKGLAAAQDEALDILFFDQHLREYLTQEQGIGPESQLFLIGRPVSDLIHSFGFRLEEDSGRRLKLVINDQASFGNHKE
jgi:Fe-S-cluster containining protein